MRALFFIYGFSHSLFPPRPLFPNLVGHGRFLETWRTAAAAAATDGAGSYIVAAHPPVVKPPSLSLFGNNWRNVMGLNRNFLSYTCLMQE